MWEKISSKIILNHSRLKVAEDLVRLPSGKTTDYLRFEGSSNGVTIICRKNDKYLVEKEYSYPINKKLFQFPGGGVKNEEKIKDAAERELLEECGLKTTKSKLLGSYFMNNRRNNSLMYIVLVTGFEYGKTQPDPEEEIETFWFSEQEIKDKIKTGNFNNGSLLSAWSIYQSNR